MSHTGDPTTLTDLCLELLQKYRDSELNVINLRGDERVDIPILDAEIDHYHSLITTLTPKETP